MINGSPISIFSSNNQQQSTTTVPTIQQHQHQQQQHQLATSGRMLHSQSLGLGLGLTSAAANIGLGLISSTSSPLMTPPMASLQGSQASVASTTPVCSTLNNSIINNINSVIAACASGLPMSTPQTPTSGVGVPPNEDHVCGDCQEIFKNKVSFNLHRRQKHGDKSAGTAPVGGGGGSSSANSTPVGVATAAGGSPNTPDAFPGGTPAAPMRPSGKKSGSAPAGGGKTFTCDLCGELYKSRQSFTRHKNRAHPFLFSSVSSGSGAKHAPGSGASLVGTPGGPGGQQTTPAVKTRTVKCGKCDDTVSNQSNLCAHLREKHRETTAVIEHSRFTSIADFFAWKSEIEKLSKTVYLKRRKKEHGDMRKHYYYCRRSGCFESKANGIRARISNKVGFHCTGFMTACENVKTNEVSVEYCTFHYCQDEEAVARTSSAAGSQIQGKNANAATNDAAKNAASAASTGVSATPATMSIIPVVTVVDGSSAANANSANNPNTTMNVNINSINPNLISIQQQQQQPGNGGNQQTQQQQLQLQQQQQQQHQQSQHHQQNQQQQQPQFVSTTLNLTWPNFNNLRNVINFDPQPSTSSTKDNISKTGMDAKQQHQQQQQVLQQSNNSTNLAGRLVSGTTNYLTAADTSATIYGYELMEQGKVCADMMPSISFSNATDPTASLFLAAVSGGHVAHQQQQHHQMAAAQQHQVIPVIPVNVNAAGLNQQQLMQQNILQQQINAVVANSGAGNAGNSNNQANASGQQNQSSAGQGNNGGSGGAGGKSATHLVKETLEYVECAANNLKVCSNFDKKFDLIKNVHQKAMELFNLSMWLNEDERSKRAAGSFQQAEEILQYGRQSEYANYDVYEQNKNASIQNIATTSTGNKSAGGQSGGNAGSAAGGGGGGVMSSSMLSEEDEKYYVTISVVAPQQQNALSGQQVVEPVRFRIKPTAELGKLKRSYAERHNVFVSALRFVYRNHIISDEETPNMLKMDNDDIIQVFAEQST